MTDLSEQTLFNFYTPVVIFSYNRLENLQLTLNSLSQNFHATESDIFIYSDAAKNDNQKANVALVREYLKTLTTFKKITIIERETNFGLAKNIIEGVTEIINRYEKVIVLEDDLISSPNFLCYMNAALNHYQNRKDIFAISGYTAPLKSLNEYDKDTYLSYRPSSWGWATWKEQWQNIDWDVSDFDEFSKNQKKISMFNRGGIDMSRMLRHYMEGKNHSWAIRWSYAMYKQGKYAIYPKQSKIQNIGFGEDATHCSNTNIYKTFLDDSLQCTFDFSDATIPNYDITKEFKYQYSYTNKLIKKTLGALREMIK